MESKLRQGLIKLAQQVPELRRHLVPLLKEAEGYDRWKDDQLERGQWPSHRRPLSPSPLKPQDKGPKKFPVGYVGNTSFKLPGWETRNPDFNTPWQDLGTNLGGYTQEDGYIRVSTDWTVSGPRVEWRPDVDKFLHKLNALVRKTDHFSIKETRAGWAVEVEGWYRLEEAPVNPKRPDAMVVDDAKDAVTDYVHRFQANLRP